MSKIKRYLPEITEAWKRVWNAMELDGETWPAGQRWNDRYICISLASEIDQLSLHRFSYGEAYQLINRIVYRWMSEQYPWIIRGSCLYYHVWYHDIFHTVEPVPPRYSMTPDDVFQLTQNPEQFQLSLKLLHQRRKEIMLHIRNYIDWISYE